MPRAPGIACSRLYKKNENGVMRNAGADAAWEKPPPTDVEQRRDRERRGEEREKRGAHVVCGAIKEYDCNKSL